MHEMLEYEDLSRRIGRIPASPQAGLRHVEWLTTGNVVGVARDALGRLELVLRGGELKIVSRLIENASDHRLLHRAEGAPFEATRLIFPAFAHFDQVAAFICVELLRNGVDSDLPQGFARTEPIIELAITNLTLSNQEILGLAGELLVLEALCRRADDSRVAEIIAGWSGWKRSSRDIVLREIGLEVKTTTGNTSSHLVEGVHQVERDVEGGEGRLFLVSIGLQRAAVASSNSFTIPVMVERIATRISEIDVAGVIGERFVARVAEYGADAWIGYDHSKQASDPAYMVSFQTTFVRAYNMDDAAIHVPRRLDLAAFGHIITDSVKFRVDFASGAISAGNPTEGANQVADMLLDF